MPDYLVFQAAPTPGAIATDASGRTTQYASPDAIVPYRCVGGVRAPNVEAASRAVVGVTRHVGKYALIEATFVDFASGLTIPDDDTLQLNP